MATKKTFRQERAAERKREIRRGLAELKRKGLYNPKGSVRAAKGNSYQAALVSKYRDVIAGSAQVVKVDRKAAEQFKSQGARTSRNRVVVDRSPGERVTYSKKTGQLLGRRVVEKNTRNVYREIVFQKTLDLKKLPKPKKGQVYRYRTSFTSPKTGINKPTAWWPSLQDLADFLSQYDAAKSDDPEIVAEFAEQWTGAIEIQSVVKKTARKRKA